MLTAEFWGQATSIVAMTLIILSFQPKKIAGFYALQLSGNVFFAISFLLLGNVAGGLMNAIGVLRAIGMLCLGKKRPIWALVLFNVLFVGAAVFAGTAGGDGPACIVALIPQIAGTFSMWYGSDKAIRWVQLCVISPCWLLNNTLVTLSLGGFICEVLSIISTVIFMIRVRNRKKLTDVA